MDAYRGFVPVDREGFPESEIDIGRAIAEIEEFEASLAGQVVKKIFAARAREAESNLRSATMRGDEAGARFAARALGRLEAVEETLGDLLGLHDAFKGKLDKPRSKV